MLRALFILLLVSIAQSVAAQHARLYAVVLANEDPANFMAGSSLGSGLWQSDDTGRTWKQLGWKHIKAFSMDHDSNGRVLYLAAGNGVLKSTDHGESWKVMTDWRVREVMDVKVVKQMPSLVLAATALGIIKSTDHGNTWRAITNTVSNRYTTRLLIDREDRFYACTEGGLYRSTDEGESWHVVKGSPRAARSIADFKDIHVVAGDSGAGAIGYDEYYRSRFTLNGELWDIHYATNLNRVIAAGRNGVSLLNWNKTSEYEGPKNTHAVTTIGTTIFAGTLGDGLWCKREGEEWQQLALPKSQIWTLKTAWIR